MASFNPLIKPKAHVNRNGFDLSQNHKFTAKPGMLLPILSIDCVPNDYHEIDVLSLMKTLPVNTDAFVRAKQHFEFYFVPYSLMWSNWHNFIVQNQSERTSTEIKPSSIHTPTFHLSHFLREVSCVADASAHQRLDNMGLDLEDNALRLADLLGYGSYYSFRYPASTSAGDPNAGAINNDLISNYNGIAMNPFRIGAYNKIWYDYYRNKWYDNDQRYIYTWNFDDVNQILSDDIQESDLQTYRAISGVPNYLCAHNRTQLNSATAAPYGSLFTMHYRQWKKDLFMSAMPSQQFGAVSAVDLNGINLINATSATTFRDSGVTSSSSSSSGFNPNSLALLSGGTVVSGSDSWSVPSAFDVYALRKAEVLQKWKESTLRAGVSAESQYRAHYGSSSKWIEKDQCEFIGAVSSDIEINPIYSTAATSDASLGEIAGRGQSFSSGKTIKFKAEDFGVLMCIYSILPESEYDATMVDKNNTLVEPFDFFTPEFEDLGLEPIPETQLSMFRRPVAGSRPEPNYSELYPHTEDILGYTSRYYNYKTAVDKLHGQFQTLPSDITQLYAGNTGSLTSWTIPRSDMFQQSMFQINKFYVNPRCDEFIFAQTGTTNETDNFLVNAYFDIKSVRPMSVLGLPQW